MQTHVRVRCGRGHVRDLTPDDISLPHRDGVIEGFMYYCDGCGALTERRSEPDVLRLLLAAGVALGPPRTVRELAPPAVSPARLLVSLRALLDDPKAADRFALPAPSDARAGRVETHSQEG